MFLEPTVIEHDPRDTRSKHVLNRIPYDNENGHKILSWYLISANCNPIPTISILDLTFLSPEVIKLTTNLSCLQYTIPYHKVLTK
jgi:hypothetical protein